MDRNVPVEHLVPERDCGGDEERGAARPLEPTMEPMEPEHDTTPFALPLELQPPIREASCVEVLPVLEDGPLLAEAPGAVRGAEAQAMYNLEVAILQQGLAVGGEYQGEEAEDDEDRELETEPEAEGTQDLAEADQSPAAEQDVADQQPEDAVLVQAVGGADSAQLEPPTDDGATRATAPDPTDPPTEDPTRGTEPDDGSSSQQEGHHLPPG